MLREEQVFLILLLFAALIATSYCQQDVLKTLPDPSVFEMKPPKEFLDLFQPDSSKNLNNPMKSPLIAAMTSGNLADVSKLLPDPSVFELKPPKEFLDLFRFKEKENVSVAVCEDKENNVSPNKEPSEEESVPEKSEKLPKVTVIEMEPPKENTDSFHKNNENLYNSKVEDTENLIRPTKESGVKDLPDKKYILDPKVFEMKPPKEFLDLFQLKDKKILVKDKENDVNHMKSPSSDVVTSFSDEKSLPDPSVFEMKPPKEFLDLFQFKHKETFDPIALPDEKKTVHNQNMFKIKPLQEFSDMFQSKDKEPKKPVKWPSWSFETNNFSTNMKFPDWFYLPSMNPSTSNTDFSGFQNIFDKKEDNKDIEVRIKDKSNIINKSKTVKSEDQKDKVSDKIKDITDDIKVAKSSEEENVDASNKVIPPLEKLPYDEESAKTNKYSEAIIFPTENVLIIKDTTELVNKPPSKPPGPDHSVFVPVQLMASPQNQHYGFGNMILMSPHYPSQNQRLPMLNMQMASQGYGYVYTNQPNNQIYLSPHSLDIKPQAFALSRNVESSSPNNVYDLLQTQSAKPSDLIMSSVKHSSKDNPSSTQVAAMLLPSNTAPQTRSIIAGNNMVINNGEKSPAPNAFNVPSNGESNPKSFTTNFKPETINQGNMPMNPPNVGNVQSNSYPQNQQPGYMNVPYGSNRVPLNYVLPNAAPLNGQPMHTQIYQGNSGQGAAWPNYSGGYQNIYALVPVANNPKPYFYTNSNVPSNGNGYQVTGQVYNLVPAQKNVLLTTKDEEDL